jgi:type I restriction enzyme R subunit
LNYLDAAIDEGIKFMNRHALPIQEIIESAETFKNLSQFNAFADNLSKTEELKKEFSVYQTAIISFYEACKPDILTEELLRESRYRGTYKRAKEAFEYLRKIINRKRDDEGNFTEAKDKADVLIDESIVSAGYTIDSLKEIDLSQIDFNKLQERFKESPYKNLSITDMVDFLKERTRKLLERNVTRVNLAEKLQEIINNYNTISSDVEAFFKALREYAERLREEEKRAAAEGLTEAELEIFDLLFEEHLSEADTTKVKEAAQALLQKLKDNEIQRTILSTDWHKHPQLQGNVKKMIGDVLNLKLPKDVSAN